MKKTTFRVFALLVLIFAVHAAARAQTKTVEGRVTDNNDNPVSNASVVVKGAPHIGTNTSEKGTFGFSVPATADSIIISRVGYASLTVFISGAELRIKMLPSAAEKLDEIVVVGYGTQKKGDLTAPVTIVNTENMMKRTTATPMDALQGSVPGVQVVSTGAPGASPDVRIRGIGSFNNSNPLYVVDGMFVNDIGFLNPNDIADMSILKDASGAAIYGVRAANGVVLITTKKGKLNMKTRVTYNGYVGLQKPFNLLKMADGAQFTAFALQWRTAADSGSIRESARLYGGSDLQPTTSTDWYDQILRSSSLITNHGIDLQGGSDKVSYTLGLNYTYQNGILIGKNDFNRYNMRLQMEARAFPWLKVGFGSIFNNSIKFDPNNAAFLDAYTASPLFPAYDHQNVNAFPEQFGTSGLIGRSDANPIADIYYYYNRYKQFQVLPTVYAEANFWSNKLTFRSQVNLLYSSGLRTVYTPLNGLGPSTDTVRSHLRSVQDRNTNYILDNLLTYKDAKGAHHWSVLLGQSTREEQWRQTMVEVDNISGVEENWYANSKQGQTAASYYGEDGTRNSGLSFFGRASYDYDNKYLLTATFRRDGSSKYQTKWGNFPSVGLGWVVSRESFMKDLRLLDFLKLRGSWGKLGNDGVNANAGYAIVTGGNAGSAIFGSNSSSPGGYTPGYIVNNSFTHLTWETVEEWDLGVDFEMMGKKLKGSVDYFNRETQGAALSRPFAFGAPDIYGNWADMTNSGFDISLSWNDQIGEVGYQLGGNLSTLKNKVTNIGSLGNIMSGYPDWTDEFPNRIQVGQPIYYFYGYQVNGIYQTQQEIDDDPVASAANQQNPGQVQPGFFKYRDQNGDGVLTGDDRINLGSYIPKLTYGFNIALDYKKIDLSIAFQGVSGNKVLNLNRGRFKKAQSSINMDAEFIQNLWTGPGSTNSYPSAYALTQGWNKPSAATTSFFVEDGSYLRVQNIQLGYNFKIGKPASPIAMRVYATADRPFIFTRYSGFTPEIGGVGYDAQVYPTSATYSLGVRASF